MINIKLGRVLLHSKVFLHWKCNNKLLNKYVCERFISCKPEFLTLRFKQIFMNRYYSTDHDNENVEYESNYTNVDFDAIARNNPEKAKLLKLYQLEIDVMYQQGERVPLYMRPRDWEELLLLPTKSSRNKYLNFLWLNEVRRQNHKKKQEERAIDFQAKKARGELIKNGPHIQYTLCANTMFHRIYETQMNFFYNYRTLQAMMFGFDILIDCSYHNFMNRNELSNCAKQLTYLLAENRMYKDPFNIIFCNLDENNPLYKKLKTSIPTLDDSAYPFHYSAKGYLDLYPQEKLVYLSPHCKEELEQFNPNDIYIVGAMVDRSSCEPVSMEKAKKDNIRMAKFPLDRYLHWGLGVKSLPLNQVINIMNDLKTTGDWNIAFQHVPKRKLMKEIYPSIEDKDSVNERITLKSIRNKYRRNVVYDLLLRQRIN